MAVGASFSALAAAAMLAGNTIASPLQIAKRQSSNDTSGFRYLTNQTQPYQVTSLPDINFNLGEFYSGSVPIEQGKEDRTLFFTFKPAILKPTKQLTIWLNGGPGCSSLDGFLEENGPWLWSPGTSEPEENPYTWANLTNMLWVEQPVGTGFAQGAASATSEEEIAQDFIKFFKNWQQIFGIENYEIYVTGESYGGRYVPYISAAMLDANDTQHYNLSGAIIYDPVIGNIDIQESLGMVPLVNSAAADFSFNQSVSDELKKADEDCGWASWREKYLTYPPPGQQPVQGNTSQSCQLLGTVDSYATYNNPCFSVYNVAQECPEPSDVLGFNGGVNPYFNRTDVKKAIHAPENVDWRECGESAVLRVDNSADSIQHVIPQIIEATNRILIGNGDLDAILPTVGTLLAIQNMTWGGKLGLQEEPKTPVNVVKGPGFPSTQAGIQSFERGLMWTETFQSGHMQPQFQPATTYQHLQWLLGQRDTL